MSFTLLGLALIAVAWGIQFLHSWRSGKTLSLAFVTMYGAGVAALIIDAIGTAFNAVAWLNLIVLLLIVLLLLKIHR